MLIWDKRLATHLWVSMASHRCKTLDFSSCRNDTHSVLDEIREGSVASWLKGSGDAKCFLNACLSERPPGASGGVAKNFGGEDAGDAFCG